MRALALIIAMTVVVMLLLRRLRRKRRRQRMVTPRVGNIKRYVDAKNSSDAKRVKQNVKKKQSGPESAVLETANDEDDAELMLTVEELDASEAEALLIERDEIAEEAAEDVPVQPMQVSMPLEESRPESLPPKFLSVSVLAREDEEFGGYELLQTLLSCGLRFGDMHIFCRHEEPSGKGKVLFYLADATEPGTFDLSRIGGFSCQGLTLFMDVSQHKQPLRVFDLMLETAGELARELKGSLVDEQQSPLSGERVAQYRLSIRHYVQKHATRPHATELV